MPQKKSVLQHIKEGFQITKDLSEKARAANPPPRRDSLLEILNMRLRGKRTKDIFLDPQRAKKR